MKGIDMDIDHDDAPILVVDFEFTTYADTYGRPSGFFPEIIEVGAVELVPPDYANGRTYQDFVKPRFFPKLSDFCKQLALIEQADVDGGIDAAVMLERLAELFDPDRTWLVAWGDSDYEVLATLCQKYKLTNPFPPERYIDLAAAYRDHARHTYRSPLSIALAEHGIERDGFAHTAMDDTLSTAELLRRMLASGWRMPAVGTGHP